MQVARHRLDPVIPNRPPTELARPRATLKRPARLLRHPPWPKDLQYAKPVACSPRARDRSTAPAPSHPMQPAVLPKDR
ncbi:hypothetical protein GGTG_03267 [Gaeumannomyces tritici R3-111a-1]|uniref:Uncharacterized protein n=1 Tax=Gaeumannomyces tritici (strain R3-111a-1) TaxID=644352 RepID=J3NPR0_GAET3|nr:hypothetical protein GGTG_03267 [Gaeumannomyces tritici R3-111a-1]EJT78165.1 hypothetical protein GGTG_03267 [Gaeumannomyces tritici R3-111a-1]